MLLWISIKIHGVVPYFHDMKYLQEKYASMPEELGKDINGTQSYMRRHEAFENELVALEAQVKKNVCCIKWWM